MAYTGGSIVDYLKSVGQASDYSSRANLAAQKGIQNYRGTAAQNAQLLNMMNQQQPQQNQQQQPQQNQQPNLNQTNNQQQNQQLQEQINQLQQQIQHAQTAGYGQGGSYQGQDIPEDILSGDRMQYDTGNPQLDELLNKGLVPGLQSILDSGKVLNPDVELTPAQITEFTNLASSKISPYYRSQIESIQKDLGLSVDNLQKQYEVSKQGAEEGFKQSLGTQRESMSGLGTTFSGQRGQAENQMVSAQNRALNLNALQTENQIGGEMRRLEGQIGSSNLPSVPSWQTYQATAEGKGGFTPGRVLNFGGTGGVMGSLPQEQIQAEELRLSKYKKAARENRSLDYYL